MFCCQTLSAKAVAADFESVSSVTQMTVRGSTEAYFFGTLFRSSRVPFLDLELIVMCCPPALCQPIQAGIVQQKVQQIVQQKPETGPVHVAILGGLCLYRKGLVCF